MRNRQRIGLKRGPAGRGPGSVGKGGLVNLALTILTITDDGGLALVTTAAPHGITELEPDLSVVISGTSVSGYNGAKNANMVSATTFQIGGYTADSTGGTWRRA